MTGPVPRGIVAAIGAASLVAACASTHTAHRSSGSKARMATTTSAIVTTTTATNTTATTVAPSTSTTIDPGQLPQTSAFPTSASPQFHAEMADLWQAVVSGSAETAYPAFFPEGAYVRLKGIANPAGDYATRLLGGFTADVRAVHDLLGAGAATATLIAVNVPEQYGHWVKPGTCANTIGYFEVPNARVVYREHGQIRSFGIASLISWRGEWYVVHLGAILRTGSAGVVDDPAAGPGVSQPSTT